ncbi:MAG: ABC transporter ATP-binding protein [Christensenellales bacterium]
MNEILTVRGVCAGYGARRVLEDVGLSVGEGEVCALLGLNGSGKSTLLRVLLGLLPVQTGEISVCGGNMRRAAPQKVARLAAYLPQRSRADDGMTALEIVLMGANAVTPLIMPYSAVQREKARMCLERMGAGEWADRRMGELSQGQRQSVLLARALMQSPKLLLLDEPDAALDLPRRWQMLRTVSALVKEERCAALCALHDASLALSVCDSVAVLSGGRIVCPLGYGKGGRSGSSGGDVRAVWRCDGHSQGRTLGGFGMKCLSCKRCVCESSAGRKIVTQL